MRYHRTDVVERAILVLDDFGLGDLSMRRLAHELDLQPSALYHHFPNKQTLLAAVADEVLRRGEEPVSEGAWDARLTQTAIQLRDTLLAYRDGAELVATAYAFGLGAQLAHDRLAAALTEFDPEVAVAGAETVLHFVLGLATDEQTRIQAVGAGAIDAVPRAYSDVFRLGLGLIVDGLRTHQNAIRP